MTTEQQGFIMFSFDLPSLPRSKEGEPKEFIRKRKIVGKNYRKLKKCLSSIGFFSQKSVFFVPKYYKSTAYKVRDYVVRSLSRINCQPNISIVSCDSASNKSVIKSVLPSIQYKIASLTLRAEKRGNKALTKKLKSEIESYIPLIELFGCSLAGDLKSTLVKYSKEKILENERAVSNDLTDPLFDLPQPYILPPPVVSPEIIVDNILLSPLDHISEPSAGDIQAPDLQEELFKNEDKDREHTLTTVTA